MKNKINYRVSFIALLTILSVAFWLYLYITKSTTGYLNSLFSLAYAIIPVVGGLVGIVTGLKCLSTNKPTALTIVSLSAGTLIWGVGQVLWGYYALFLNIESPYPSVADAFFILGPPLWILGLILFTRVIRLNLMVRNKAIQTFIFIIPFVATGICAFITIRSGVASTHNLTKLFFDIAYPSLDLILLSMFLVINLLAFIEKEVPSKFKLPMFILTTGAVFEFIADIGLSYTSKSGT
ncbi:MAG: hypothetical protein ACD_22C00253G0001, partial [uncultured bacterium]